MINLQSYLSLLFPRFFFITSSNMGCQLLEGLFREKKQNSSGNLRKILPGFGRLGKFPGDTK